MDNIDFEELQIAWITMNEELKKQKKITSKIIIDMTKQKYKNKYSTMKTIESVGLLVCYVLVFYLIFNFDKLHTWYLKAMGIFTIVFHAAYPILSLNAIFRLNKLNLSQDYTSLILDFKKRRNWFLSVQQLGIAIGFLSVITTLPVVVKISNDKDLMIEGKTWLWYLPIAMIFMIFFSRWGYHCYKKMTLSAEQTLTELE